GEENFRADAVVVVLELDVVLLAGFEGDLSGLLGHALVVPAIDDELAVDPEADAIVATGVEGVFLAVACFDLTGPADAEGVTVDAVHRAAHAPIEVDDAVDALALFVGQVEVIEILALQAAALGRLVDRRRIA